MPRTATHFPPPSQPEARFDAVVARGEQLRRRDRTARRLVTGGAVAAVLGAVLIVGVLGSGRGADQSPATRADDPGVSKIPRTTVTAPDRLTVRPVAVDGAIEARVDDPHFAVTDTSKLCARIRIQPEGPAQTATAQGSTCWSPTDGDAATATPAQLMNGVELGCGGLQAVPVDPSTTTVAPSTTTVSHRFRFDLPAGLPPARYVAEVTAVSSTDQACAGDEATGSVAFDQR